MNTDSFISSLKSYTLSFSRLFHTSGTRAKFLILFISEGTDLKALCGAYVQTLTETPQCFLITLVGHFQLTECPYEGKQSHFAGFPGEVWLALRLERPGLPLPVIYPAVEGFCRG